MESGAVNMVNSQGPGKRNRPLNAADPNFGAIISTELFNDFKAPAPIFKPLASLITK